MSIKETERDKNTEDINQDNQMPPPDFLSKVNSEREDDDKKRVEKKLSKREIFIITAGVVILLIVSALFLTTIFSGNKTPQQAINEFAAEKPALQMKTQLAQISLDATDTRHVVVYKVNGGVAFAVVERDHSGYKLVGEITKVETGPGVNDEMWAASPIKNGKDYLVVGVIKNLDHSRVKVNEKPATVIDNGDTRCWFYINEGYIVIGSGSITYE